MHKAQTVRACGQALEMNFDMSDNNPSHHFSPQYASPEAINNRSTHRLARIAQNYRVASASHRHSVLVAGYDMHWHLQGGIVRVIFVRFE
ncbi:MAG: hypothetical protein DHS20C16_05070 [Phycisphaerae bacterium]|nr:MAG: hypothetical protein DHS20C16_05070 [Phycisphaerae bacterium]